MQFYFINKYFLSIHDDKECVPFIDYLSFFLICLKIINPINYY
jgi:hypothetical protein